MKKQRIILLLSLFVTSLLGTRTLFDPLGLSGAEAVSNTVYLNLTKIGKIDNESGTLIEDKYLEYGYVLTLPVGQALPGSDRMTSTTNATFVGWVIQSPFGGLQKISTMPSASGLILQAHFSKDTTPNTSEPPITSEPITSEPSTSQPDEQVDLYLRFNSGEYLSQYRFSEGYSQVLNTQEYFILGVSVTGGQSFHFGTPTNFSGLNDETLPTYQSNKPDGIGYTLSNGAQSKTTDYLQVNGASEQGPTNDGFGSTYHKYISPTPVGTITFKTTGVYDIYVVFWDNYGWAQIYVAPH